MSKVKHNVRIILSREAVRAFFEDELIPYGSFDGLTVVNVAKGDSDTNFVTLYLEPKPKAATK